MSDALLVLTIVQAIILVALLIVMLVVLNYVRTTGDKAGELLGGVNRLVTEGLQPTMREARSVIAHLHSVADGAARALDAAEPVVSAFSQLAGILRRPTTPIWVDALRLTAGVVGVLTERRKASAVASGAKEE